MTKTIIEIKNLTKKFGNFTALNNLNLKIEEKEIFGFIGPNGAGKSTTIRLIMNLLNKTNGEVLINDKTFNKDDIDIKEMIGYLPSEVYLYDDLTVKQMLDYHETFYKKDIRKKRCELVKLLKVDEKKKIEDLSLGNKKKVGIILALMHEPKILILDEPTSGLDPIMQEKFFELLKEEKNKGTTIIYSTHILSEVSKICDRVAIIKNGNLLKVENVKDISSNLTFITITSSDIELIENEINMNIISREERTIKFKNEVEINTLIKKLSKYKIDKLLIEEASLDDLFLNYYS